jgi:hypothetical protein
MKPQVGLLLISLTVSGCARTLQEAELPGRYEFQINNLKQQVTVSGDHKYTNVLYRDSVVVWSDHGTWTYDERRVGVTFGQFRFGIPGHSAQPGYWFVVPQKTFTGTKQLCFDPDLDRCFKSG